MNILLFFMLQLISHSIKWPQDDFEMNMTDSPKNLLILCLLVIAEEYLTFLLLSLEVCSCINILL